MTQTTDLESAESAPKLREMVRTLSVRASMSDTTGAGSFVLDLMEQILGSTTEQMVFELQESGMKSGKDFAGRPFLLKDIDIEWRKASPEFVSQGAFPFYAIIKVREIATNEEVVLNCGGNTFVASLYALEQLGYFDSEAHPEGRGLIIVSNPSPNGAYLTVRPVRQPEPEAAKAAPARGRK